MSDFMKKPCSQCPYRKDVKPFLRAKRGEELAYHAHNPYNSFPCHKTLEHDEEGEAMHHSGDKQCAGFLSLMHNETGETPYDEDGFEPSPLAYEDSYEMTQAYEGEI